ncbi:MAG TPA: hypothetical protein VH062_16980 [Polyangiaceae bacterium]|nr:hypothetical protein [Polyangiaceae bacterium]
MHVNIRSLFVALLFGAPLAAQSAGGGPPPHGQPPQEAIEACASKAEGDACSVTFHDRTMDGTCRKGPNGEGTLACAPKGPPPGPPPEAVQACANLAKGDACKVTFGDHTMEGTCVNGPSGNEPLACFPARPPNQ